MLTGDMLKNIRLLCGLSQKEMGDLCGYSLGYIQALETGKAPINSKFETIFFVKVVSNSGIMGNIEKIFSEIETLKKKYSV